MIDLIQLRRELHRYPELGFTEFRTAAMVVKMLTGMGYRVIYGKDAIEESARRGLPRPEVLEEAYQRALREGADPEIVQKMRGGYTAVVAELEGMEAGPTTAFRFDMDALPITESALDKHTPQATGFRSEHEGIMHACAHDGHTAMGLALADRLKDRQFAGKVRLLFQPAEEGVRGAYAMVEKGMLDQVDRLFCLHLGVGVPSGHIRGAAAGFLATTKLEARFTGISAHAGASPEEGRNALLGASTALLNIHALPRFSSADTRINVGVLEGGTGANIIAEHARMIIETRSADEATNRELERRVRMIIEHSARMHELQAEVEVIGGAIPIRCDLELAALAVREAGHIPEFTCAEVVQDSAALGSEDASYMIRRVQEQGGLATYMIIGTQLSAPHHHPGFDIDEAVLEPAVNLLERLARTMQ
ncbi:amidohydrolase [Paenibacillus campinasensis]|uniref:Aminobenzoyl-glutamate utilization protein A n=1 Tax=Paenibacillus campinasensis TaxID=66347 RepID=A0A268EJD0_9BACL|nr:amidohydrolase [Paenibacillus campinasensis]PAD73233.1 aminobenzoyl-glutamate utilization protein A [Paenibacillus campinasensis]